VTASLGASALAAAVATGEEADDDTAELDNGADDGLEDAADTANDGHDGISDGLETRLDLLRVLLVNCYLNGVRLWWLTQETTPPILDDLCSGVCLSGCVLV
jgi:hypothetical protein